MRRSAALLWAFFIALLPASAGAQSLTPAGTLTPGTGVAAFLTAPIAGIPSTWLQPGAAVANLGSQAACTFLGNATGSSSLPTAVSLGAGLACSGGTLIATGSGGGTPAGSNGDFQINSAGSFGSATPGTGVAAFFATPIAGIPATWLQSGAALANLSNGTVTLPKLAPQVACTIVANATAGTAVPTAVTLGTGLACSGGQIVNTGAGSGDVTGPASATPGNIATYNGVTGKIIQDGGTPVSALVPTSRTITGAGLLTGGGDGTANRTITFAAQAANTVIANVTGSTAVPTAAPMPTCPDVGGNHLNYGSGVFSCGISGSGGAGSIEVTDTVVSVDPAAKVTFDPVVFAVSDLGSGEAKVTLITTPREISGTTDTVIATDANKLLRLTNAGAITLNLTAAATLGANFGTYVECVSAVSCTINPAGAETIDGAATLALGPGVKASIDTNGTSWFALVGAPKDPTNASNLASGLTAVARGGTGLGSGTSGGILAYTASGTLASSGALTAGMPMIGGGAGVVPTVGTRSGNTTAYVSTTGTQTSGRCVEIDANGNHIAAAVACGSTASFAAIGWVAATNPSKAVILTATTAMTVTAIRGTVADAVGATAVLTVYKAPSGTVCTSGTAQHTGTFNANGTAATNQTLTLAGGGVNSLSAGDRLCLGTSDGAAFTAGTGNGGITVAYTVP